MPISKNTWQKKNVQQISAVPYYLCHRNNKLVCQEKQNKRVKGA